MSRMSEKFVEPQKNFPRVARKAFLPLRGSGGMLPEKILNIMCLRLAKIAFYGISVVKIKCHLTMFLKRLINLTFFMKGARVFLPCV